MYLVGIMRQGQRLACARLVSEYVFTILVTLIRGVAGIPG